MSNEAATASRTGEHDQGIAPVSPNPPIPQEGRVEVGVDAVIAAELAPQEKENSHYVFKRLNEERKLPSKYHMWIMLGSMFLSMFLAGWNDASQGPLIPSLQEYYHLSYLLISIVFICNFVGFLLSGIANIYLTDRFGFGIVAPFGAFVQGIAYALMCCASPYPLFCIAYVVIGFGLGTQDAQVNTLTSRLPNASPKMFLMHAVYGLGATISPLVATAFVKQFPTRVYLYFAVSLALGMVTVVAFILTFRGRTYDQIVGKRVLTPTTTQEVTPGEKDQRDVPGPAPTSEPEEKKTPGGSGGKMMAIMKLPTVHFLAFYTLIYVGIEVTLGGWITSFLLTERGGNQNVGYVTTGYFGGITLGRVLLIPVTNYIGKHNSVYIYTTLALILEILVHVIHSIPANSAFFVLIGFLLGPIYPIIVMVLLDCIPPELQGGTIGWVASLGQAGSAILPFITGVISNKYGVWILQPFVIAFLGFSFILWTLVPRQKGLRV